MPEEMVKLLAGLGVGGVLGVWALLELRGMRREQGEAAEKQIGWLVALHSRLSSLGADSIPPPIAPQPKQPARRRERRPSRFRFQTAPTGYPVDADGVPQEQDGRKGKG